MSGSRRWSARTRIAWAASCVSRCSRPPCRCRRLGRTWHATSRCRPAGCARTPGPTAWRPGSARARPARSNRRSSAWRCEKPRPIRRCVPNSTRWSRPRRAPATPAGSTCTPAPAAARDCAAMLRTVENAEVKAALDKELAALVAAKAPVEDARWDQLRARAVQAGELDHQFAALQYDIQQRAVLEQSHRRTRLERHHATFPRSVRPPRKSPSRRSTARRWCSKPTAIRPTSCCGGRRRCWPT